MKVLLRMLRDVLGFFSQVLAACGVLLMGFTFVAPLFAQHVHPWLTYVGYVLWAALGAALLMLWYITAEEAVEKEERRKKEK